MLPMVDILGGGAAVLSLVAAFYSAVMWYKLREARMDLLDKLQSYRADKLEGFMRDMKDPDKSSIVIKAVLKELHHLPADQQRHVLDFASPEVPARDAFVLKVLRDSLERKTSKRAVA